jgi:hypothetical protein
MRRQWARAPLFSVRPDLNCRGLGGGCKGIKPLRGLFVSRAPVAAVSALNVGHTFHRRRQIGLSLLAVHSAHTGRISRGRLPQRIFV